MMLPSTDFESVASTSFATEASCEAHYTNFYTPCQEKNDTPYKSSPSRNKSLTYPQFLTHFQKFGFNFVFARYMTAYH